MRFFDVLKISIRNIKGKGAVLVALGMAISAFCLCYAGAIFVSVSQEKAASFELIVSTKSSTGITDTMLTEISQMIDVEDVTSVLQIPIQMKMGEYSAQLTLTGVKPSYLSNRSVIPEESVMPYMILNEAACKLFSKDNETTRTAVTEVPPIDWMNTKAAIWMDEENTPVISKVCGILASEKDDEPAAYISLNAAKSLLKTSGQPTIYQTAYVRIKNIGCAESASRALGALQLTAANADAGLQAKWETETKEMTYLIVVVVFSLLCSVVFLFAWRSISINEQQNAYAMLHWIGMKKRGFTWIFALQSTLLSLIGVSMGILTAIVLPSFLSQDLKDISIFMLPIPIIIVFFSMIVCMSVNVPFWLSKYDLSMK